ncbi:MAG: glutamate-5-semialdehyde dehydrogenase, partial [Pseudobdellovibrio sp.]
MAHELKLRKIKSAAKHLRLAPVEVRNAVLIKVAELLVARSSRILKANIKDLKDLPKDTAEAFRDRLTLT